MTDYVAIAETETDPKKPARSSLFKRFAKNWIAGFEGATGAPRFAGKAVAKLADLPVLTVAAADTYNLALSVGVVVGSGPFGTANPPTVLSRRITNSTLTGSIRLRGTFSTTNGANTARIALYKNGVLNGTVQSTTSTTAQNLLTDITLVPGDVIEWRASGTTLALGTFSETASDGFTQIIPLIPFSSL